MIANKSQAPAHLPVLLIVVLIFILTWLAVGPLLLEALPLISHANARHGTEADTARQCNQAPNAHIFFNPTTERTAKVCDLDGMFGMVITDKVGQEVTAFLKNKMTRFEQVLKYMNNQGYQLVQ